MRSRKALAASATVLISLATAIAVGAVTGSGGDAIIHFGVGAGFILLALAAFDFGIPRWAAWVGALAAGAFGTIFVMQGVADVLNSTLLHQIAYDTLGHEIERILPDVVYVWFVALLLFASQGKTRVLGAIVMTVVIGFEVATGVAMVLGISFPTIKILLFAPFIWLLFEAVKPRSTTAENLDTRSRSVATAL